MGVYFTIVKGDAKAVVPGGARGRVTAEEFVMAFLTLIADGRPNACVDICVVD